MNLKPADTASLSPSTLLDARMNEVCSTPVEQPNLAQLYLALSLRNSVTGNKEQSQRWAAKAFELAPNLVGNLKNVVPDLAMKQSAFEPSLLCKEFFNLLEDMSTWGRIEKKQALSITHVAQGFAHYESGQYIKAREHFLKGILINPGVMKNRGNIAALTKSIFRPWNNPESHSDQRNIKTKVPQSIIQQIEKALHQKILHIEEVPATKTNQVYMLQFCDSGAVLRIVDFSRERIELTLELMDMLVSRGIPAPKPLTSSLTLGYEGSGYHWMLETKLPGHCLNTTTLNNPDLIAIAKDLAKHLRMLHEIPVHGYGIVKETSISRIEGSRHTQIEWLNETQKPIIEACLNGLISDRAIARLDEVFQLFKKSISDPPVLCHGDLHQQNILLQGNKISGLIDWDYPVCADPAFDVAIFLRAMLGHWPTEIESSILQIFVDEYQPTDPSIFRQRVSAYRIWFIAESLMWMKRYFLRDEQPFFDIHMKFLNNIDSHWVNLS
jgi:aminoglycoside phosphotransferase (APT) family kinase protein